MATVQLTKDWSTGIFPNKRRAYTSMADMAGWFIYENTQALAAKWTRVWESNGAAGPANDADATQRLISVAACSVRGANAASAQSWGVYENSIGVQILIAFQGTTDDVVRIAYSPSGVYARAATATHQPTAADEVVVSAATSVINNTATLDRVMTIWCIDDDWRFVVYRSNALACCGGVARITPLVSTRLVNPIFSPPYMGWRYASTIKNTNGGDPTVACTGTIGNAGYNGGVARVHTDSSRVIKVGGGEILVVAVGSGLGSFNTMFTAKPALQNGEGMILLPLYRAGERAANVDGVLGVMIDWWVGYGTSINSPDYRDSFAAWDPADTPGVTTPRANWLMTLGSAVVWPWCNVAATLEIS
jgi:hypothetical protein